MARAAERTTSKRQGRAAATKRGGAASLSAEERRRRIAEAAYFRAQRRGFQGGDPRADWLAAEAEVDAAWGGETPREDIAAYVELRDRVRRLLAEAKEAVDADTLRQAIDKAGRQVRELRGVTAETVTRVSEALKRDIASTAERLGPGWESFSERSADLFAVWRDRGSAFLARGADAVGDWLRQTGVKLGHPVYHTGDMTYEGTLECTACGEHIVLPAPGHVPPCPRCYKTEFRRV